MDMKGARERSVLAASGELARFDQESGGSSSGEQRRHYGTELAMEESRAWRGSEQAI
jgi:hypothetical protein